MRDSRDPAARTSRPVLGYLARQRVTELASILGGSQSRPEVLGGSGSRGWWTEPAVRARTRRPRLRGKLGAASGDSESSQTADKIRKALRGFRCVRVRVLAVVLVRPYCDVESLLW